MTSRRGVIYYAIGEDYLEEAKRSAYSLREHNEFHITLFTDQDVECEVFDKVKVAEEGSHPFHERINCFQDTPYERTLFLDTDTTIEGDIEPIFNLLDRFDIVARQDPLRDSTPNELESEVGDNIPEAFPEYNCGVIGFRKSPEVFEVFDEWKSKYEEYLKFDVNDQPFFREAIYDSDLRIGTLPSEYNCMFNNVDSVHERVRVFHGRMKYVHDELWGKRYTREKLMKEINSYSPRRRVFYAKFGKIRVKTKGSYILDNLLPFQFLRSLRRHGISETVEKARERF